MLFHSSSIIEAHASSQEVVWHVYNMYSQKEEGICSFVEKKSYVYARYEKQGLYRP